MISGLRDPLTPASPITISIAAVWIAIKIGKYMTSSHIFMVTKFAVSSLSKYSRKLQNMTLILTMLVQM